MKSEYKITNIINYLRKSRQDIERERKTGEDTLSEQKKLMERILDDMGIPYEQRLEIGSGDQISTRPIFQSVIEDLKNKKYDAIAVKEISRLGRGSYTDMGIIYDLLRQNRIYIITPWKIYDPNNNSDARQIRFELFLSREEFETTKERLIGSRYNYAMEGKWVAGSTPFGYNYNQNTQRLEESEEEAKIVRLIFNLYVNGIEGKEVSFRAISTYLRRIGIKTPKGKTEWRATQVRQLIENPVYIGQVRFRITERVNGKVVKRPKEEQIIVDDAHKPIIDLTTWNKSMIKIQNKTLPKTKLDFSPCELASLIVCKKCRRKMVRQYSVQNYKRKDGEISKYHKEFLWCTTSACTFVKYRDVESTIISYLEHLTILDDNKLHNEILNGLVSEDEFDYDEVRKSIEQRKRELQNRLKFVFEKYESGIYSDTDFIERKSAIEKEMSELELVNVNTNDSIEIEKIDVGQIKGNINSVLTAYNALENKTRKNTLLRAVFDYIDLEVIEKGRGAKPTRFELTPILKADLFRNVF
ncbi:recombinase family protein [Brevibacillus sp. NRS-1366]|uniref:recombinase family protein n=1 Tax=Brevibacillus sp. NRS-1366 TaxID=3233899 RepID=UPI003D1F45D0